MATALNLPDGVSMTFLRMVRFVASRIGLGSGSRSGLQFCRRPEAARQSSSICRHSKSTSPASNCASFLILPVYEVRWRSRSYESIYGRIRHTGSGDLHRCCFCGGFQMRPRGWPRIHF